MDKNFNDIDKLAREAFENFETAYNPEDWKLMEEKLNKKEHLMPYIWLYKGTEILVFLLIIFTAFNFWQSNKESNENLSELSLANSKSHNSTVIDKTNVYNQNNATAKGQDDTQIGSSEKVIVNNSNNGNLLNANQASKSSTKFNGLNDAFDKSVNSSLTDNSKFADNAQLNPTITESNDLIVATDNAILANETSFKVNIINIPTLSFNQKKLNPGDGVEEGKGFGIKTNFKFPKIYRRQQRATFYAGADVNFNNSLGQGKLGLSIGALIEQEISDRFAVRSGLIMNRKAFEKVFEKTYDNPIDENSIIQSEISQKSTLVMISLPVFLNTVLYRDEKWKVSLSTGFAAGMLTNRIVTGTQRSTVSQLSGSLTNISQLNSGSYPKGVLQGGLAAQNFFMSAAIGADVERQLGDRITLFVQPMFSQNLNKIEGNEMYRQLSLNAGIKTVIR
jgi:hypothetical protein